MQKLKEETKRLNLKLECSEEVMVEKDDVLEKLGVLYRTLKDECDVKSKGIIDSEKPMIQLENEWCDWQKTEKAPLRKRNSDAE